MENILLFAITAGTYSFVWFFFTDPAHWTKHIKRIALIALLVLPLNINGNVFTIAGNATAEKSVYSVLSLYQRAEQDAVTLFGLAGYQQAGHSAETGIGLVVYQQAGQNAGVGIGIVGYQQPGQNAGVGIGLVGYQQAGHIAETGIAIALYQRVGEKTRAFGAFSVLTKD